MGKLVGNGDRAVAAVRIIVCPNLDSIKQVSWLDVYTHIELSIHFSVGFVLDINTWLSDAEAIFLLYGHNGDGTSIAAKMNLFLLIQTRQGDRTLKVKVPGKSFSVGKVLVKGDAD